MMSSLYLTATRDIFTILAYSYLDNKLFHIPSLTNGPLTCNLFKYLQMFILYIYMFFQFYFYFWGWVPELCSGFIPGSTLRNHSWWAQRAIEISRTQPGLAAANTQILAVGMILTLKNFLNFSPFPSGFNPEAPPLKKNKALDRICKILIWDHRDILSREDPKTTHSIGSQVGVYVPSSKKTHSSQVKIKSLA